MRRKLFGAVALLCLATAAPTERSGPVDWIFLVDTSKSMRGAGGSRNIFPEVQSSIETFIDEAKDGDSVAIYTFDRDVQLHSVAQIGGSARDDLRTIVSGLYPDGNRTHLGKAIQVGLERAASSSKDPGRVHAVVLFTDGKEDVRGIEKPVSITSNLRRIGDSFVFFVSLGDEHESQLDELVHATSRGSVIRAPDAQAVRGIADKIRAALPAETKIPPPPSPPPPPPRPPERPSAFRWLILVPILVAVAAALFIRHRHKNQLEGELEILRPRVDSAYVGLPRLAANEVVLSSLLPLEVLGGTDARLFVRWREGAKRVWISATRGPLRVNEIETPEAELFDADTIELGDAKLRFNRVGHERPEEEL